MTCELAHKHCMSVLLGHAGGAQDQLQVLDPRLTHIICVDKPQRETGQATAAILLADVRAAGVAIEQSQVTIMLLVPFAVAAIFNIYPTL